MWCALISQTFRKNIGSKSKRIKQPARRFGSTSGLKSKRRKQPTRRFGRKSWSKSKRRNKRQDVSEEHRVRRVSEGSNQQETRSTHSHLALFSVCFACSSTRCSSETSVNLYQNRVRYIHRHLLKLPKPSVMILSFSSCCLKILQAQKNGLAADTLESQG
jgi:hypothetical protein